MNIGSTISGCTVLGLAPAGDGESYILLLKQPGKRVQYVTGRVGVRQLPHPEEWWSGTYSSELEDAVKHWVKRSCIADDDPTSAVKWLTRLIENTEKALDAPPPPHEPGTLGELLHERRIPGVPCGHEGA